jgi:uncharacterized protein
MCEAARPRDDEERCVATVGTVRELVRYPVKSLQGETLPEVAVNHHGLEHDRAYAVRDLATGKVASAKQPNPWAALLDCGARYDRGLCVTLPDGRERSLADGELDAALSGLVGREVAVVGAARDRLGTYESQWPRVPGVSLEGEHEFPVAMATEAVSFVDLAAIHLLTTASLRRLQQLAGSATVDPRRFRPNLVIDTGEQADFLEDTWVDRRLRVGEAELQVTLRTPRCVMPTLAQPGLAHEPAVLRAAATNRHDVGGVGAFACAGVYAEVVTPGAVRLDDPVELC